MKRYTITEDQRRDAIEYADALIEADQGGSPKDMAYRAGIVEFINALRAAPEATQAPAVPSVEKLQGIISQLELENYSFDIRHEHQVMVAKAIRDYLLSVSTVQSSMVTDKQNILELLKDFGNKWEEENDVADYTFEQFQEAQARYLSGHLTLGHQQPSGVPSDVVESLILDCSDIQNHRANEDNPLWFDVARQQARLAESMREWLSTLLSLTLGHREGSEGVNEWDAMTKEEMWNEIQAVRKATDNDGTSGAPHVLVEAIVQERDQLRADIDQLLVTPPPSHREQEIVPSDYSGKLWRDCKDDDERFDFILSGRAHETGIMALAIQNEVAMAFKFRSETMKERNAVPSGRVYTDKQESLARFLNQISQNLDHFDNCSDKFQKIYRMKDGWIMEHLEATKPPRNSVREAVDCESAAKIGIAIVALESIVKEWVYETHPGRQSDGTLVPSKRVVSRLAKIAEQALAAMSGEV